MLQALDRITFNPQIMVGQACVRGMRIPVSLVVNLVANGKPNKEILEEYPDLELEDIQQALQYAAWLTTENISSSTEMNSLLFFNSDTPSACSGVVHLAKINFGVELNHTQIVWLELA